MLNESLLHWIYSGGVVEWTNMNYFMFAGASIRNFKSEGWPSGLRQRFAKPWACKKRRRGSNPLPSDLKL